MEAWMDSYTQMSVGLDKEDIEDLENVGYVIGEMWRSQPEKEQEKFPLGIFIVKDEVIASGFPQDVLFEEKEYYKLGILEETVRIIKEGKSVSGSFIDRLRSVYIFPEGSVF